jgi:hypothetical protein
VNPNDAVNVSQLKSGLQELRNEMAANKRDANAGTVLTMLGFHQGMHGRRHCRSAPARRRVLSPRIHLRPPRADEGTYREANSKFSFVCALGCVLWIEPTP